MQSKTDIQLKALLIETAMAERWEEVIILAELLKRGVGQ